MSRIQTIPYEAANSELKLIYDQLIKKRGKLAAVHTIQSLHPASITAHMDLYMEIMFSKSGLTRAQREMMAVVVSAANKCNYCIEHHRQALLFFWKDTTKVNTLKTDFTKIEQTEADRLLCEYAYLLTVNPEMFEQENFVQKLQKIGFSDTAILNATMVIAYFNFVNRIVLSLGVELESHGGKGYQYE